MASRDPYLWEEDSIKLQKHIADPQKHLVSLSAPGVFEDRFTLKHKDSILLSSFLFAPHTSTSLMKCARKEPMNRRCLR
jgi:hypothetical protein